MFRFIQYSLLWALVNGFIGKYTNGWTRIARVVSSMQQGFANELVVQSKSSIERPEVVIPLDADFIDILFPFPESNNNKKGNGTMVRVPNDPSPIPVFGVSLI